ncbi:MAG: 3-phosphoshikimate 1-carboxyvinyltransferase [Acidobacteriota bacterium]
MTRHVEPAHRLVGSLRPPGDKSVSHRALILSALATGETRIRHLATGADVASTRRCLEQLGVLIEDVGDELIVHGVGLRGLERPSETLACGNSGTTLRLLSGVVAGAGLGGVLDGDESLRRRPMRRIVEPLQTMGAACEAWEHEGELVPPLSFVGGTSLAGRRHDLTVTSAQVKSCLLLAGLFAEGETRVREPRRTRAHAERMLTAFGVPVTEETDGTLVVTGPHESLTSPEEIVVPGDPSSAAFFAAAAATLPGSSITLHEVDLDEGRLGLFQALQRMGASVTMKKVHVRCGEPVGDVVVHAAEELRAVTIGADELPSLVDEVPVLAVVATQARGRTVIEGAGELRHKESDRLATITAGLQAVGARVEEKEDGLVIEGPARLAGGRVDSAGDHRIAMAFAVAGLFTERGVELEDAGCVEVSYPDFFERLGDLLSPPTETCQDA